MRFSFSSRNAGQLAVFLLLESGILLLRLLPVSAGESNWPGPDLGLCLLFAWIIRRPDQIPALAVALFYLLEDLLLFRPIGLWALMVLLASEVLRRRETRWRDQPFLLEWLRIAALVLVMQLAARLIQVIFLVPVSAFGMTMLHYAVTMACYPLVVFAARWLIGLRRLSQLELELQRQSR